MKRFTPFLAILASLSSASMLSTTAADPVPPVVGISASDPVAFKNLSSGAFTIYRDQTNDNLTVTLQLSGTVSNGVDIAALPGSVVIPAGFHAVGLTVQPLAGGENSPGKWVQLTIVTNSAYALGTHSHAKVEVRQNAYEDRAPVVSIFSPADGSSFSSRSDITVTADVNDPDGDLSKVSFFANDHFLGQVTGSPYSVVWTNVSAGKYALFARAEDRLGKSTLSAPAHITVTNITPVSTITLTSPTNKGDYAAFSTIPLVASVGTNASAIKSVSFYSGNTLLGTVSSAPYSLAWTNVAPGHYELTAKATEISGAISSSPRVRIDVTNIPPTVTITAPADNATIGLPGAITLTAQAGATKADVASVMFFSDNHFIGTVKSAPYTLSWTNAALGKHTLVAQVTDSFGEHALSRAVHITLTNPLPVVNITSPTNHATISSSGKLVLTAEATDADGIRSVTFWNGRHSLGTVQKAPYSVTLDHLNTGTFSFKATATDGLGQTASSPEISLAIQK